MKPRSGRSEFYAPLSPPVFTSQYHAAGALSDETDATVQQYQEYSAISTTWASAWSASGREGEGRET